MARRDMRSYKYVDDKGDTYQRAADKSVADQKNAGLQSLIGAVPADGSEPNLPRGFKPRTAAVVAPDGVKSRVVCFTATCDLYTKGGEIIVLHDASGAEQACRQYSTAGERNRKRTPGV